MATLWATGKPFLVGFDMGCPFTGPLTDPQPVTLKTDVQGSLLFVAQNLNSVRILPCLRPTTAGSAACTPFTLNNKAGSTSSFSFTGSCDFGEFGAGAKFVSKIYSACAYADTGVATASIFNGTNCSGVVSFSAVSCLFL